MIHRAKHNKDNPYTMVACSAIKDEQLSDSAFRLLVFMLSNTDNFGFTVKGLAYLMQWSERKVSRLVNELKKTGYVVQVVPQAENGRFMPAVWDVYEEPVTAIRENRKAVKPQSGGTAERSDRSADEPQSGKRVDITNINLITKNNSKRISKENKARPFSALLDPLQPELRKAFEDFIQMRKELKSPLTERALELNIEKARKLGAGDPEKMKAIVEQSIEHSWQGLYELKEEKQQAQTGGVDWAKYYAIADRVERGNR